MYNLSGEYDCKIDAKGRLKMPTALLKQLGVQQARFTINRGFEKHLMIYPQDVWEKKTKEINHLNIYVKKNREAIRYFHRGATQLSCDASDRILVPKRLKEYADLEKEITNVDQYFGTTELPGLLKALGADYKHELIGERLTTTPKNYAYLKIAEGCDRPCSFCAIPIMRGKHKSTPIENLVTEAEKLAGVEGFEPPAIGFGDRCSTNWNYTPKILLLITHLSRN